MISSTSPEDTREHHVGAMHHTTVDSELIRQAMAAADEEKAMGFRAVMKIHWKAAMWSCIFSLALVMEGYDLGIVSLQCQHELTWNRSIPSTVNDHS